MHWNYPISRSLFPRFCEERMSSNHYLWCNRSYLWDWSVSRVENLLKDQQKSQTAQSAAGSRWRSNRRCACFHLKWMGHS
jgi:hypothetical protein